MKLTIAKAVKQEVVSAQDAIMRALALVKFDSKEQAEAEKAEAENIGTAALRRFHLRQRLADELEWLSHVIHDDSNNCASNINLHSFNALRHANELEALEATAVKDDDPARLAKINLMVSKNGKHRRRRYLKYGTLVGLTESERSAVRAGASVIIPNPGGWNGDYEVAVCNNPKQNPDHFSTRDLTIEENQVLEIIMGKRPLWASQCKEYNKHNATTSTPVDTPGTETIGR